MAPEPVISGERLQLHQGIVLLVASVVSTCAPAPPAPDSGLDGTASPLPSALWVDVTDEVLDSTAEWSNKVELADLNGDGWLDILFANGGDYSTRVHDRKSPSLQEEWQYVEVRWTSGTQASVMPMTWYGEYLWSATVPESAVDLHVCAADRSGNETCAAVSMGNWSALCFARGRVQMICWR